MGLDITHMKITTSPTSSSIFILKDELTHSLVDSDVNSIPFQTKVVHGTWEYIAIFENEADLILAQSEINSFSDGYCLYHLFLTQGTADLKEQIKALEDKMQLNQLIKKEEPTTVHINGKSVSFLSISYEGMLEKEGVFVKEAGYQRKGMANGFSNFYQNDSYYQQKENFEKLLEFRTSESQALDAQNIETNFIENYEAGKSLLGISW